MADGAARELGTATAPAYAAQLLAELAIAPRRPPPAPPEHPAQRWAQSGLMWLTGAARGEPQMCPAPLAACADGALAALASLAPEGAFDGLRGAQLLAERAAITGARRNGAISAGGSCRLLEAADGWIAVNLARADDWALLPAWLECDGLADWPSVACVLAEKTVAAVVARGRLMGLAVAASAQSEARPASWFYVMPAETGIQLQGAELDARLLGNDRNKERPLVVDLSSLWAGPLCASLLQACGARVIKVESISRPDGARDGPRAFFDLLNSGKSSVALDFGAPRGRAQLRALLEQADIVIEASRPRALRQLGVDAAALLRRKRGLTWLSITAYGRVEPQADWAGFGDDAAVAAGTAELMHAATGQRLFAGDAIADPLTGLHAALAAWAVWLRGGGPVSLALRDVVSHCLAFGAVSADALPRRQAEWTRLGGAARAPAGRAARGVARPLGADTASVLGQFGIH